MTNTFCVKLSKHADGNVYDSLTLGGRARCKVYPAWVCAYYCFLQGICVTYTRHDALQFMLTRICIVFKDRDQWRSAVK